MITIPDTATHVYWPTDVAQGYDFKAGKRYKIKRYDGLVMIFNPDQITLSNGEVTEDILEQAIFE